MKKAIGTITDVASNHQESDIPYITFADEKSVLRQVNIAPENTPTMNTMLEKSTNENEEMTGPRKQTRIDKLEANSRFLACNLKGQWSEDNPRFLGIMEKRDKASPSRGDQRMTKKVMRKPRINIFRRRSQ